MQTYEIRIKGEEFCFEDDRGDASVIEDLREVASRGHRFASELVDKYSRWGWSHAQESWSRFLSLPADRQPSGCKLTGLGAIVEMFDKASANGLQ
jgi:hypothetical protein